MSDEIEIGGGLTNTPKDERDFIFGSIFGTTELYDDDFQFEYLRIANQGSTDMCGAFALCGASELQEDVVLSPEFTFGKIKEISGDWKAWGANLNHICRAALIGFLPQEKNPYKLEDKGRDFVANPDNWKGVEFYAEHRKDSYFKVDESGYTDLFDAFRGALQMNRAEERAILTGAIWEKEWTRAPFGIIPKERGTLAFGHAFIFIGQKFMENEIHLVAQLSNGTTIGHDGLFYFPREVVNRVCTWGGYTFKDLPKEQAKYMHENKLRVSQFSPIRYWLSKYFRSIFSI